MKTKNASLKPYVAVLFLKSKMKNIFLSAAPFFEASWSKKCFTFFFKKGSNVVFLEEDYKDSGYRLINT